MLYVTRMRMYTKISAGNEVVGTLLKGKRITMSCDYYESWIRYDILENLKTQ